MHLERDIWIRQPLRGRGLRRSYAIPTRLLLPASRIQIRRRPNWSPADDSHRAPAAGAMWEDRSMQDLLWILITLGLMAATLAYARLCDNA